MEISIYIPDWIFFALRVVGLIGAYSVVGLLGYKGIIKPFKEYRADRRRKAEDVRQVEERREAAALREAEETSRAVTLAAFEKVLFKS